MRFTLICRSSASQSAGRGIASSPMRLAGTLRTWTALGLLLLGSGLNAAETAKLQECSELELRVAGLFRVGSGGQVAGHRPIDLFPGDQAQAPVIAVEKAKFSAIRHLLHL